MVEINAFHLDAVRADLSDCTALSAEHDVRWAGVVRLAPNDTIAVDTDTRNDFYLIAGELKERGKSYVRGTFLRRGRGASMQASERGALIFVYRDTEIDGAMESTILPQQLAWFAGGGEGMRVAVIASTPERLMLVSWVGGTTIRRHSHVRGEEIFVLEGELRDERGRYPQGTWVRLHPGAMHAPYAETPTLTLVRSGHLQ
jgi:hypothetical protein